MKISKTVLTGVAYISCLVATHAVHFKIVNENKKEIKVKVEPEAIARQVLFSKL